MELGTTLWGIVILLICIIPFGVMYANQIKTEKEIHSKLKKTASSDEISGFDIWRKTAIGISSKTKTIYFYKEMKDQEFEYQINLNDVQNFKLDKIVSTANHGSSSGTIDSLILNFRFKDALKENIQLIFFDYKQDGFTLSGELQLIEKWQLIIKKHL